MIRNLKICLFTTTILFALVSLPSCKKKSVNGTGSTNSSSFVTSPNIVFIIADDMGWDAFGHHSNINSKKANTPTLDSLANSGITFTNFWSHPECSPTRAALLTGEYAFRTGVGAVQAPPTQELGSSATIIQKYITDNTNNAYATALIGKWHVSSYTDLNAPLNFGVQYFSGILTGAVPDYYNWTEIINGSKQNISTYSTTQFVNQSISWIQQQSKPFFLWLAFNAPHTPFHRPPLNLITDQSLVDDSATISANPLPYYLAAIEAMDKEIGRLIVSMTPEQKANTVFIFMGDNGTPGQVAQTPYTSLTAKGTLYQGGVNTPLIVCGKNVTRKNEVDTTMIQDEDMFSTLADIAGTGTSKYMDGISIKPLFANASSLSRNYVYTELFGSSPSTRHDGYSVRNSNYKLIVLQNGNEYLYKVSTDPFEQTNLMLNTLSTEAQQNLDALRQIKAGL